MGPAWPGGVLALLAASLLIPPLVSGLLVAMLIYLPLSGSLPRPRPGIGAGITRVFDSTGAEMAAFRRFETTLPAQPTDIPDHLEQAVVSVEDQRFYFHRGVDSHGILRALFTDAAEGAYAQGASTITQQLVRLQYTGDDERTLSRKLREAVLARRLESRLSKDEILYRYLSRVYLGGGAYGVGAAAQSYFRKPVRELNLSEAALLAGIIPAPTRYDPRTNPGGAESQRRLVLDKMLEQGRIDQRQYDEAAMHPVYPLLEESDPRPTVGTAIYPVEEPPLRYPYFTDYVRRYLIARYGEDKVYGGGLQVHASIDPRLQHAAETTVAEALKGTSPPLEIALVSVEPSTGLVRALVGGRDFDRSNVNLALGNCTGVRNQGAGAPICVSGGGGGRQPGSAFKPFTLARALEEGRSSDTTYPGPGVYRFPGCRGRPDCTVRNVESGGYGPISLRKATESSVNTVFAQLVQDVGVKDTAELAHRLGLTMVNPEGKLPSGQPYGPSLTLGTAEVSPRDMAAASGVFASRGQQFPASPVIKVIDASGEVLEDNTSRIGRRVLGQDLADEVNYVLSGVISSGPGRAADLDREGTAGKTGTSEAFSDAWFVGYTKTLSTAVWMGHADSRRPLRNVKGVGVVYGGTLPARTWKAFMTEALADVPASPFPLPARVAAVRLSPPVRPPAPVPTVAPADQQPPPTTALPSDYLPDPATFLPEQPPATELPPPVVPQDIAPQEAPPPGAPDADPFWDERTSPFPTYPGGSDD